MNKLTLLKKGMMSGVSIFFIALMLSCSNRVENDAKKQMEITMNELAKDPSSVQITDVKTMISNDSICILHFRFSAKNGFGAVRTSLCEYIYLISNRHTEKETIEESVIKLDEKDTKSVLEQARKDYNEKFLESDKISSMKDEDRKAWHIYLAASLHMIVNGRTVGKDKYDINNW